MLAKDSLFQKINDCKGIHGHYSNSFDVKYCQPGNALGWRKELEIWSNCSVLVMRIIGLLREERKQRLEHWDSLRLPKRNAVFR